MNYLEKTIDTGVLNDTLAIITEPVANVQPKLIVILTNAGLRCRIGPHRLYTELARQMARYGCVVIRYDSICTGDAEKGLNLDSVDDYFIEVEKGLYVDGLKKIILLASELYPEIDICLGGLCGGALTSIYTYEKLSHDFKNKIHSFFLLGLVFFKMSSSNTNILSDAVAMHVTKGYIKKLFDITSWKNLLKGDTDIKLAINAFLNTLLNRFKKGKAIPDNLNIRLVNAIKKLLKSKKSLFFAYGEYDILLKEYEEGFENYLLKENCWIDNNYFQKLVISNDSHNLFYQQSIEILATKLIEWVNKTTNSRE